MNSFEDNSSGELPPEVLMRGLLRAYYWMDESLQNGLQRAGYRPRTRTQTMILIHISNGVTRAAELARALGVSRQAIQQQINELDPIPREVLMLHYFSGMSTADIPTFISNSVCSESNSSISLVGLPFSFF